MSEIIQVIILIFLHNGNSIIVLLLVSDLAAIRKILENETGGTSCPSCKMPFDKGKKRKLIDTCGHDRCYSCMFKNESCTVCVKDSNTHRLQRQDAQRETSAGKLSRLTKLIRMEIIALRSNFQRDFARFYDFTSLTIIYAILNCK